MDIREGIIEASETLRRCADATPVIQEIAGAICRCLLAGGSVFWLGNGGSAADAQHLSAELVGRYRLDRAPLSSFALTVDTSALTAIANDYGYKTVFSRQVRAHVNAGDVVVGISTSGQSESVLLALKEAQDLGAVTVGLCGQDDAQLSQCCRLLVSVPSDITSNVQTAHIMLGQLICGEVEATLFGSA